LTSNLRKNNVRINFKCHQQHWRQILEKTTSESILSAISNIDVKS